MKLSATLTAAEAATQRWEAIVIGGGPAGALAALLLARQGRKVLLVERRTFPRAKVCGGCLSASGVAILEQLLLLPTMWAAGARPLHQLQARTGNSQARLPLPDGLSITRSTLDALLVAHAIDAGAAFLSGITARVVDDDTYIVQLHDEAAHDHSCVTANASAILVADGLGHPSLRGTKSFREHVQPHSRIGVACVMASLAKGTPAATISMNVGVGGYVGLVHVEAGQTCIAAALDPELVRKHHGVPAACAHLLRGTGIDLEDALAEQTWLGAPQLTRRTLVCADKNVLLLGDACGYVEPFTGEGMTWAMMSAVEVQPFVASLLSGTSIANHWTHHCQHIAAHRQRWCRSIAYGLRTPWLAASCVRILQTAPALARPIVSWITQRRIPELAQVGT